MRKRIVIVTFGLFATVFVTPSFAQSVGGSAAIDADVSLGGSNGVNANAGASLGTGANADVDASVGGSGRADASASASVGGGQGIDADIRAGAGQGANAAALLALGGGNGANAAVTAGVGDNAGSGSVVDDVFGDAGLFAPEPAPKPAGGAGPAASDGPGAPGIASIAAFNAMPADERRMVIKRCRDVVNGGYDRGLVSLCRLLQSSASR